jgi:hypothetical protein
VVLQNRNQRKANFEGKINLLVCGVLQKRNRTDAGWLLRGKAPVGSKGRDVSAHRTIFSRAPLCPPPPAAALNSHPDHHHRLATPWSPCSLAEPTHSTKALARSPCSSCTSDPPPPPPPFRCRSVRLIRCVPTRCSGKRNESLGYFTQLTLLLNIHGRTRLPGPPSSTRRHRPPRPDLSLHSPSPSFFPPPLLLCFRLAIRLIAWVSVLWISADAVEA